MSGLADIPLKTQYRKGRDDIATDFYIPCMRRARTFDRAVGFFSSSIYVLAWEALRDFVSRRGTMRLICSPVLSREDIEALSLGYEEQSEVVIAASLSREIDDLLADPLRRKPAVVLASLISSRVLEVKIAVLDIHEAHRHSIFHDKVGLFFDEYGNTVAFKGSMNETWSGLASDGNLESVDVFVNWSDRRDQERVGNSVSEFNALWKNEYPTVKVHRFPEAAEKRLLRYADPERLNELVDEIMQESLAKERRPPEQQRTSMTPREHQVSAIAGWKAQGRRGILKHATGSGKTFTALIAIRDSILSGESVLVLVPSELLLKQWATEMDETLSDLAPSVLLCGAGNVSWREPGLLSAYSRKRGTASPRIVLSTMQTASSEEFISRVNGGPHLFLVADEVHRVGSQKHQNVLRLDSGPRLGLSATPERAGDPSGTAAIFSYFGGIVPPAFTLADAIAAKTLTPYYYFSYPVPLTPNEQAEWDQISEKIRVACARSSRLPGDAAEDYVKHLLIQRARIVKAASEKVPLALRVVQENYAAGERWIVYCDSQVQLDLVLNSLRGAGIAALEYHSAMTGDRERTLSHFEHNGGVLVSIKCLDEGIDIPAVTHALILASSKNPREFIQRRGRVLRKFPGKNFAVVHDAIVVPDMTNSHANPGTAILVAEIARAIEFSRGALNPSSANDLELIVLRAGMNPQEFLSEGVEDEEG